MPVRPRVVTFDLIGTVFSLEPLRGKLMALGLPPLALEFLYAAALRDSFAMAATTTYAPFLSVLEGCLDEALALHGEHATDERKRDVLDTMHDLPPHDDAGAALALLAKAGVRVIALSNGSTEASTRLLQRAELKGYVEQVLSVEDVKLSKPRPEAYLYAAQAAGVAPAEMMLVAAHAWDVHGAKVADLMAGYVTRGRPFPLQMKTPDVSARELLDVARAIVSL